MESAILSIRRIGGAPWLQYLVALLAQAHARIGKPKKGLIMLNEALAHVERTGEKADYAEMLRLKGELLSMCNSRATEAVEACFRQALEVAHQQEAKWWELRACVSLAQTMRDTNRRTEALAILGEIYGWFTEGFDTAGLKEAKALIDQLS